MKTLPTYTNDGNLRTDRASIVVHRSRGRARKLVCSLVTPEHQIDLDREALGDLLLHYMKELDNG